MLAFGGYRRRSKVSLKTRLGNAWMDGGKLVAAVARCRENRNVFLEGSEFLFSQLQRATMARSKLLSALDAHKGRNYKLELDKKLRKAAEKRKSAKRQKLDEEEAEVVDVLTSDRARVVVPSETADVESGVSKKESVVRVILIALF
jgi:hypothetical protein